MTTAAVDSIWNPIPPREMIDAVGGGDYELIGQMVYHFVRVKASVLPTDDVLDIGSGCGRIAIPFARYLAPESRYDGFDIVKTMVDWCSENITSEHPNFRFKHVSLSNTLYSPEGNDAGSFVFPYEDQSFDVVFATSVFTHLVTASARQYAKEVARVLRPGGRGLLTFYIVNDEFRRQKDTGKKVIPFGWSNGEYSVTDPNRPEAVVAFEEPVAREILESGGLKIDGFSYGEWRVPGGWTYQDAFLVSRA